MMIQWRGPATAPPRPRTAWTMRRLAPAAGLASSPGIRWDRTSRPAACGPHAARRQRTGGSPADGRHCGHGGDDRETGATGTQPSRGYNGMLNESRLCHRQVVLCRRCDHGNIYCSRSCGGTARQHSQRLGGRRYQNSRRGRHKHARRQRHYRERRRRQAPENRSLGRK